MKAKILITSILAFTLSVSAQAAPALSKKRLEEIVKNIHYPIGIMQVCGQGREERSSEYSRLATEVESNLLTLVDRAGYDADAFWGGFSEKLAVTVLWEKEKNQERTAESQKSNCKLWYGNASYTNSELKTEIQKLASRSKKSNEGPSCPLSADTYQERFSKNGKMSDLTCFQKAGMRELEAAQQQ